MKFLKLLNFLNSILRILFLRLFYDQGWKLCSGKK